MKTKNGKIKYNKLDDKYNKITSINNYKEPKITEKLRKHEKKLSKKMTSSTFLAIILSSGLLIPRGLFDGIEKW